MSKFQILPKVLNELSAADVMVREVRSEDGDKYYAKILKLDRIDELGINQNLDFNRFVLGQLDDMIFSEHFLKMEEEITSRDVTAIITKPYQSTLEKYIKSKKINEKEALGIFDQILKAVYSLWMDDTITRNLRSQHIVLSNNKWRLQTLIFSNQYKQAEGAESEYLWSPKHQAPECFTTSVFADEDFHPMLVWNLGCILLEMLTSSHKFSTKEAINKIKSQPFSFKALGMNEKTWKDYSPQICEALEKMLRYDPKKRITLRELFADPYFSRQVAKHFEINKPAPNSKIVIGKSSVRSNKISESNRLALIAAQKEIAEIEINIKKTLEKSKLSNVIGNDDFLDQLGQLEAVSVNYRGVNGFKKQKPQEPVQPERNIPVQSPLKASRGIIRKEPLPKDPKDIEELMEWQNKIIIKALQLYKTYFDKSELLILALDVIDQMDFPQMKEDQVRELKLLIRYAVSLMALINLNALAEGFNNNINLLSIDGDLYTAFSDSQHFHLFKMFVNFKKTERANLLNELKLRINQLKKKPILNSSPFISEMLNRNYKITNFRDIKVAYRYIVKHAYDRISQQYNSSKGTARATTLARTAMYVTYCLTTDKLYIKEDIPDNFQFFFQWTGKPQSSYVALSEFKKYLDQAPKETLIKNSRYILKKYYDT